MDWEEGVQLEEPKNVVFNTCVLETLFRHLSIPVLKNCSLVCRAWKDEARYFLRRKAVLRFDGRLLSDASYCEQNGEQIEMAYRTVKTYMSSSLSLVPRSCCLGLGARPDEHRPEIWKFFKTFGSDIKHLIIAYPFNFNHLFDLQLLRGLMLANLPNLQYLDIQNFPGPRRFWNRNPFPSFSSVKRIAFRVSAIKPIFIKDLLRTCPNVQCIEVSNQCGVRFHQIVSTNLLESIAYNSGLAPKLNELHFSSISSYGLKVLSNFDFKLKVLHLGTLPRVVVSDDIKKMFSKQSQSLEGLQFESRCENYTVKFALPSFPKLKTLLVSYLYGPSSSLWNMSFDCVNYSQQFPILQKMVVSYRCKDDWDSEGFPNFFWETNHYKSLFQAGQVCYTLRNLEVPIPEDSESDISVATSQLLRQLFPNTV